MIALLLSLILNASAGAASPADFAKDLREGTPAVWSEAQRQYALGHLQARLRGLRIQLESRIETGGENCIRFRSAFVETVLQLGAALDVSPRALAPGSSEDEFWTGVRLRLLQSTFFHLARLFRAGADGGVDALDPNRKMSCPTQRRPGVQEGVDEISRALVSYMREGLGGPGLDQWDGVGYRLLAYGKRAESRRLRRDIYLSGATFVAGLLAWKYVPKVVRRFAVRRLPILERRSVQVGAAMMFNGFDSLAVYHGLAWLNPEEKGAIEDSIGGWPDQMTEIENMLASPKDSPERDYVYVTVMKALLADTYRLKIEDPETTQLADEAIALAGRTPRAATVLLQARLQTNYGATVECARSFFRCVRGLQVLARLFYADRIKPFDRGEDQALRFAIAREAALTTTDDGDAVTIHFPANADPEELAAFIASTRRGSGVRQRVVETGAFVGDLRDLQKRIPQTLEFEPKLSRAESWRTVLNLAGLARRRPELFNRSAEVLRIGRAARAAREENMQLVETLPVGADARELETFLGDRMAEPLWRRWLADRADVATLSEDIRARTGHAATCQPEGLTVRACTKALQAWRELTGTQPALTARDVRVYAREALGSSWDFRGGRLAVAPDFDPTELPTVLEKPATP